MFGYFFEEEEDLKKREDRNICLNCINLDSFPVCRKMQTEDTITIGDNYKHDGSNNVITCIDYMHFLNKNGGLYDYDET